MTANLLLASALQVPEIMAVRCEKAAEGVVIKVLATAALEPISTERAGPDLVITIPAVLPERGLDLPEAVAPLHSLQFEAARPSARLRVGVPPGVTLDARIEGSLLTLSFRTLTDQPPAARDVEQLYPLLFPKQEQSAPATAPITDQATDEEAAGNTFFTGFTFGPISIRPSLVLRYVNATATFLETATPVHVQYLEIQPGLALSSSVSIPVLGGRLTLGYEPRFRTGQAGIPVLGHASHFFTGGFERPIGSALVISLSDQYSRGSIETQVLDPGREYFFNLGSFRRNQLGLGLRYDTTGPFDLVLDGSIAKETVDPGTAYFDNERRNASAGIRYELNPSAHLTLSYGLERVPPPAARPLAEMQAHTVSVAVDGQLTPLLRGSITTGYRRQENPQAPAGGNRFSGFTFNGSLDRDLPNGGVVTLGGGRSTQLSAFESNAFYVVNGVQLALRVPVGLSFEVTGGVSYQQNAYKLNAQGLAEPRRDRLAGWTAGIGRPLTRWAYIRADYNGDRRSSNVPGLSARTHSFVAQLGLGVAARR